MTRRAMAAVLLVGFLGFFELGVIYVVAPAIRDDFGAHHSATQVIILAYTLPFALFVVTGGRLGDLWGIRRVFLAGVGGFGAASLLAASAWDLPVLLAARGAQGISAALMTPQVLATIRVLVPGARRGAAFARYALVAGLATMCGPPVGGLLTQTALGWRFVFLLYALIGATALIVGARHLPTATATAKLDLTGTVLAAVTVLLLIYPLTTGSARVLLPLSAIPLALFVGHERRVERSGGQPLVVLRTFRLRVFTAGLLVNVMVSAILSAFFLLLVILLQDGLSFTGSRVGLTLTPWAVGTAVGAALTSPLTRRIGRGAPLCGAMLMTLGIAGAAAAVPLIEHAPLLMALALLSAGTGISLVSTPTLSLVMSAVPRTEAGAAAGMFTTFRQLGGAAGVATAGAFFYALLSGSTGPGAYGGAFSTTAFLSLILCSTILGLIFMLPKSTEPPGRPVVLLFPGQGAQCARMAAGLYGHSPSFTAVMDTAFTVLGPELREEWLREQPSERLDDVTMAQPLLYAVNCALGRMVMDAGVRPAALLGHSVGEMAAATLAGVFSFEEGLRLMCDRVEQIRKSPPGGMLAVGGSPEDLAPYVNGQVVVGVVNAPRQTVLAGPAGPLDEVRQRLVADGFACRATRALQAFHSPLLSACTAASVEVWRAVRLRPPEIPLYSAYHPGRVSDENVLDPELWAAQPAQPVLFWAALDRLLSDGDFLLVDAGPGQSLCALLRRHPAVLSGRSAVIGLLPAQSGDDTRDREAVAAALSAIRS
ncbi:MFS transporter [Nonomuraea sediminis]|uniref:MFS transporter n=1 Tax=Nonomuraea sediminis TaxID=2835864 RepID=UPI001BDD1D6A|nr:MFS transporter [Nonomuraea sediminis]